MRLLARPRSTGASRMAQTALDCVVSGTEVGHRVANGRVSRDGAYRTPT